MTVVYLPAVTESPFGSISRKHATCIFEQDTGRPLTRHTGYLNGEFGAVKGYVLTIRTISAVGKYVTSKFYFFSLLTVVVCMQL
jgi:primary-amine oxidase